MFQCYSRVPHFYPKPFCEFWKTREPTHEHNAPNHLVMPTTLLILPLRWWVYNVIQSWHTIHDPSTSDEWHPDVQWTISQPSLELRSRPLPCGPTFGALIQRGALFWVVPREKSTLNKPWSNNPDLVSQFVARVWSTFQIQCYNFLYRKGT